MKKKLIFLLLMCLTFAGCSFGSKKDAVDLLNDKISNLDSYSIEGVLSISNNEDTYNYDVTVAYKEKDNYRVSLVNKSNGHEQIILKSNDEVYVITH